MLACGEVLLAKLERTSLSSKNGHLTSIVTSRHSIPRWAFSLSPSFALGLTFAKCSMPVFRAYQLAFFTPGICPLYASSRKQTRQIPYFLKYAWGRPQILQRLYALVENFGLRCCLIFIAVLAMRIYLLIISRMAC